MQSTVVNHIGWTALATSSVILTASYMLWMIQRVFYGDLSRRSEQVAPVDIAPTFAAILGVNAPSASVGRVLTEVLHPVPAGADPK